MEAIILAGGYGTRLRKSVPNLPKPMAPILGIPFLEILIKNLIRKGFLKIIISTFYKRDLISNYFGNNYCDIPILYTDEKEALGTGGAIRVASEKIKDDHYYVFNGDTFLNLDVNHMENLWIKFNKPILVSTTVKKSERYGLLTSYDGFVSGFHEKGKKKDALINAGCYLFPVSYTHLTLPTNREV